MGIVQESVLSDGHAGLRVICAWFSDHTNRLKQSSRYQAVQMSATMSDGLVDGASPSALVLPEFWPWHEQVMPQTLLHHMAILAGGSLSVSERKYHSAKTITLLSGGQ